MDVEELSRNRIINFQECSAATAEGIWEGLTTMVEIFERQDPTKTGSSGPSTDATNKDGTVTMERGISNPIGSDPSTPKDATGKPISSSS